MTTELHTTLTPSGIKELLDAQLVERSGVDLIEPAGDPQVLSVFAHERMKHQLVDLEDLVAKHRDNPRRAKGVHQVRTLDGVASAITRHRNNDVATPVLYHDPETLAVTVVLNDHEPAMGSGAGWRDHRITWTPTLTPEWKHWVHHQGLRDQLAFAEIIEDGEAEIADPPAADMLEIATTLHATRNAKYRSTGRPKTGITQFVYQEQSTAKAGEKGDLTIPDQFTIVVRPFFGSSPYRVKARIRYRASGDQFQVGYQLHRPDDVIRAAFEEHVATLIENLEMVDTIEGLA